MQDVYQNIKLNKHYQHLSKTPATDIKIDIKISKALQLYKVP